MSGRGNYGKVIKAATDMAVAGAAPAEIRRVLIPLYGVSAVGAVISRLRLRGQLPERVLQSPTVFHLDVGQGPASRIKEIATEAGVTRATIARRALLRGLQGMLEVSP